MTTSYQPGLRVSEYLLEEVLGRGAFGEVWRARHHIWDNDRVAIKMPTEPGYVRFLRQEGVVVHGLRHPNIVRVLGLDPYADPPYLVMELVRGPSLRAVIDENPKGVAIPVVGRVVRGLLNGLEAAHAANVVHRDLKPGNVMLDLNGRDLADLNVDDVKVGDFGLGVPNENALRSMVMQSTSIERDQQGSAIAGTLAYMAPELRDAERPPTPQTDLFAVGVILFELLTGERPAGAELPSTLRPHATAALDDVFRRLYARHDRRFETVRQVLEALDAIWPESGAAPADGTRIFTYIARGPGGELTQGQIAAGDSAEAIERLRSRGLQPSDVRVVRGARASGGGPLVDTGLMTCPKCDAAVDPEDQFCTQCGRQLVTQVRRCPDCDGWPGPMDLYCIHCGAAIDREGT